MCRLCTHSTCRHVREGNMDHMDEFGHHTPYYYLYINPLLTTGENALLLLRSRAGRAATLLAWRVATGWLGWLRERLCWLPCCYRWATCTLEQGNTRAVTQVQVLGKVGP